MRARLEELAGLAGAVRAAARHLDDAVQQGRRLIVMVEGAAEASPSTAFAARAELMPVQHAPGGLIARAEALDELAAAVESAVRVYALADVDATKALRSVSVSAAWALGEAGPFAWIGPAVGLQLFAVPVVTVGGAALAAGWRPTAGQMQHVTSMVAAFGLGALPGRIPPGERPVPRLSGIVDHLQGALRTSRGADTGLVVTPAVMPGGRFQHGSVAPTSLGDVARQIRPLAPSVSGQHAVVSVQSLQHPDGRRTWVVGVPGTQSPGTGGRNPFDMESNMRLVGGQPSDSSLVVQRAMVQAGIPPDEPVLLVGHSQGGMAAMEVAGDPALAERFQVTSVVTLGSPVAHQELPEHVQALHLEHTRDLIPVTDGAWNPDRPNRTTVELDLGAQTSTEARAAALDPVRAHDVELYGQSLDTLESSEHTSLGRFRVAVDEVLGGEGVTATTQYFQGTRLPQEEVAVLSGAQRVLGAPAGR